MGGGVNFYSLSGIIVIDFGTENIGKIPDNAIVKKADN